jgi:hypothetical protein
MSWDHLEDENLGDCVRAKSFEAVAAAIQWSVPDDVRFSDVVRAFEAEVRKAEVSA